MGDSLTAYYDPIAGNLYANGLQQAQSQRLFHTHLEQFQMVQQNPEVSLVSKAPLAAEIFQIR